MAPPYLALPDILPRDKRGMALWLGARPTRHPRWGPKQYKNNTGSRPYLQGGRGGGGGRGRQVMGQKDYNNADVETQPHAEQKNLKDFFFFYVSQREFLTVWQKVPLTKHTLSCEQRFSCRHYINFCNRVMLTVASSSYVKVINFHSRFASPCTLFKGKTISKCYIIETLTYLARRCLGAGAVASGTRKTRPATFGNC